MIVSAGLVSPSCAGMMGLGGIHGGAFRGGGRGFGGGFGMFGVSNTEAAQNYFEDSFSALVTQYDEGVAEIDDFYSSDAYGDLVGKVELLSDRYSFFLNGVDRTLARFDSLLISLNDEITYFDDLLAEYQANENLSAERLERIESWITSIQDILGLNVEIITEKKSLLAEDYATYTAFGDKINSYLDTIAVAEGGSLDSNKAITESPALAARAVHYACADVVAACEETASNTLVVPEPRTVALLLGGYLGIMSRRLGRAV
jgi:hypothetical protein